jgi:FlaG/FlaF family flagellin (archaellin)
MRLSTLGRVLLGLTVAQAATINYSTVTGYFKQDEESTDASRFDYVSGLQELNFQFEISTLFH